MEARTQKIGECHLDLGRRGLVRDGELCRLEPRDYSVLLHLIDNAPNLVPTRTLLRCAWRNKVVGDNVLHQSIGRLRRALGDDARKPIYIQTLAKIGYQFIAPVTPLKVHDNHAAQLSPIAILPFKDYSRDPNDPYVVDGLCFEICHQLIQTGVQVVSLDQAARIQRRGFTDLEVGGRLGARTVLGGSLIVSGDRLRVTANLGDVDTERQLWSAKHDFATGQILDVHTMLSQLIVVSIVEHLSGRKKQQASQVLPVSSIYEGQAQYSF